MDNVETNETNEENNFAAIKVIGVGGAGTNAVNRICGTFIPRLAAVSSPSARILRSLEKNRRKTSVERARTASAEMELREPPCRSPRIHQVTPASCSESDTDIR